MGPIFSLTTCSENTVVGDNEPGFATSTYSAITSAVSSSSGISSSAISLPSASTTPARGQARPWSRPCVRLPSQSNAADSHALTRTIAACLSSVSRSSNASNPKASATFSTSSALNNAFAPATPVPSSTIKSAKSALPLISECRIQRFPVFARLLQPHQLIELLIGQVWQKLGDCGN